MKFQNNAIAFFLAFSPSLVASGWVKFCDDVEVTVLRSTASDTDRDLFNEALVSYQALLGGNNNGSGPASDPDGFRSINWDAPCNAGPQLPFDMPPDFFATNVPRGLLVSSYSNQFRVSNDAGCTNDDKFDSINPWAANRFITNSAPRLFAPVGGDNTFTISFEVPANAGAEAVTDGFGAVFVDVIRSGTTKMTYFAESGCVIAQEDVDASPGGLSFTGIKSSLPIHKVDVVLGRKALDDRSSIRAGDIVVMDDFFYDEPKAI